MLAKPNPLQLGKSLSIFHFTAIEPINSQMIFVTKTIIIAKRGYRDEEPVPPCREKIVFFPKNGMILPEYCV
jgi:hypothetical protein